MFQEAARAMHTDYLLAKEAFIRVYLEKTGLTPDDLVLCSKPSFNCEERLWIEKKTEQDKQILPEIPIPRCPNCGHDLEDM